VQETILHLSHSGEVEARSDEGEGCATRTGHRVGPRGRLHLGICRTRDRGQTAHEPASRAKAAARRRSGSTVCTILTVHRVESGCSRPPPTRWPVAWCGQVAARQPAVGAAAARLARSSRFIGWSPSARIRHRHAGRWHGADKSRRGSRPSARQARFAQSSRFIGWSPSARIRHRHAGHWHDADKSGRGSPPILILADPGNLSRSWPGPCPRALDPGMTRPSAPRRWFVDGRFKPGHDGKATSPRQNENCWRQPSVGAAAARFARSSRFIGLVSGCSHLPRTSRPATSKTHCGPSSRFIGSTPAWSHPPPRPSQPHAEHGPRRHA